ncbi:MAG: CCA tRNA nucleotidyltransferase [Cyanobacteria bacterium M_surface_10_m2_179]|nr:CCA tRNA nucleotidyltransferase [Cyanobacteria bacterium M_surface_10_m2_179]
MDLAEALHPGLIAALQQVAEPDVELYLVGGALRDALLHRLHRDPWRGLPDIDLLVQYRDPGVDPATAEPAAHALAQRLLAQQGPGAVRCQFHHAYGTVELEWQGVWIDLATARHEHYPRPAQNPQVRPGRLEDDLARRDFSVNAMALPLRNLQEQAVVDPYGGLEDLAARQLRLLHPHSLRDDPTRALRAARYAARLGFALEPSSLAQLRSTLQRWPWSWKPGDPADQAPPALSTRLRMELELLLDHEPWAAALSQLQQWGALVLLEQGLQRDPTWQRRLRWAARLGLPPLPALLMGADDPAAVAQRLQLPHRQQQLLRRSSQLLHQLQQQAAVAALPQTAAAWAEQLETGADAPQVVQLVLVAARHPQPPWRRPLLRWLLRWRLLVAPVTAQMLLEQGYRPGPALGEALKKARAERLASEQY